MGYSTDLVTSIDMRSDAVPGFLAKDKRIVISESQKAYLDGDVYSYKFFKLCTY